MDCLASRENRPARVGWFMRSGHTQALLLVSTVEQNHLMVTRKVLSWGSGPLARLAFRQCDSAAQCLITLEKTI
jgi:hypothetical protein